MANGMIDKFASGVTKDLKSGITFISATDYSNQTKLLRQGNLYYIYIMVTIQDKDLDPSTTWVILFTHEALSNVKGRFVVYNSKTSNVSACRVDGNKLVVNPSSISVGDIIYGSACLLA